MTQKQWMWQDMMSGGVQAAVLDLEDALILWFQEPGCACSGSSYEQSAADFLARGPRFTTPPDDVLAEMRAALAVTIGQAQEA